MEYLNNNCMGEFFKEYKERSNKDITDIMETLKGEFDKTKSVLINLTLHLEDTERKFNLLDSELKKRKING
jgi:hypothetical protein